MKTAPSLAEAHRAGRDRPAAGFTLIELLTVISIIGILAGLLVGLAPAAGAKMKEARVRGELAGLVNAIEQYKSRYGFYPPDNYNPQKGVDPFVNPLYYELTGMLVLDPYDAAKGTFKSVDGYEEIKPADALRVFNRDGFANARTADEAKKLLRVSFKEKQHGEISTNPGVDVLVVGVPWPLNVNPGIAPNPLKGHANVDQRAEVLALNPWRYVSTNPTNNPNSFDLWAEVIIRGKPRIFGNWKE